MKMKAVVLEEHGTVDALTLKTNVALSSISPYHVRVKVQYCALNHLDLWLRRGGTGDRLQLPRIPGSDIAGVVSDLGSQVTHIHKGDPVLVYPGIGCEQCRVCAGGRETLCHRFKVIGYHVDGGYAQYVDVPVQNVIKLPNADAHMKEWAAVPVSYVTAWNALVTKCRIKPTDTVVIWGAAGGLGFAALTIAQGFGANVIGIVGSEHKARFLRGQGFDGHVIIRSDQVEDNVRQLTERRGADVVLDHVGAASFNRSLRMLARGGRLASCGVTTGPRAEVDLRYIFGKQLSVYGSWMGDRADLMDVVAFLDKKNTLPHIDRIFPLSHVKKAQAYMEEGDHVGKIVLSMAEGGEG